MLILFFSYFIKWSKVRTVKWRFPSLCPFSRIICDCEKAITINIIKNQIVIVISNIRIKLISTVYYY